jgi:hypothetical protein
MTWMPGQEWPIDLSKDVSRVLDDAVVIVVMEYLLIPTAHHNAPINNNIVALCQSQQRILNLLNRIGELNQEKRRLGGRLGGRLDENTKEMV